jgi:hypothetical protein
MPIIAGIAAIGLVVVLVAGGLLLAGGGSHGTATLSPLITPGSGSGSAAPNLGTATPEASVAGPTAVPTVRPKPGFSATASMSTGRWGHTATLLSDGRVLIAGGYSGDTSGSLASAELYDPAAGTFSPTGSMASARTFHTATLLSDGTVLIAGGHNDSAVPGPAEIYDPTTGKFKATGSVGTPRWGHTATLLSDGRVLIAGGNVKVGTSSFQAIAVAELYDPKTGKFATTGSMTNALVWHTATLLANGRVLLAGGQHGTGGSSAIFPAAAQLFDPATGTFTSTGTLGTPRGGHGAALLSDGRVLVVGGYNNTDNYASAELYDPGTGEFSATGSMSGPRYYPTTTLVSDGRVLVCGGDDGSNYLASCELYDPGTGKFTSAGSMADARDRHTATVLSDGRVLLVGGHGESASVPSAELYQP